MGFYVEKTDEPNRSGVAAEDIVVGTLVHIRSDGVYYSDVGDGDEGYMGVADTPEREDWIADEVDDPTNYTYLASDSESLSGANRVPVAGQGDSDIVKVKTIQDNGTDPAPSISHMSIVGYVDSSAVSGTGAEFEGRLVEEGYTDNGATTFDRATGNFVAIGRVYMPELEGGSVTDFDGLARVVIDKSL